MSLELDDKLYTSTQVADILGVSLRTLYRYMEDDKIQSMRTASGRHRFTKEHIMDFLNADTAGSVQSQASQGQQRQNAYPQTSVDNWQNQGEQTAPTMSSPARSFQSDNLNPPAQRQDQRAPMQPAPLSDDDDTADSDFVVRESVIARQTTMTPSSPFGQNQAAASQQSVQQNVDYEVPVQTPSAPEQPQAQGISAGQQVRQESVDIRNDLNIRYYKSDFTDLIELARRIKDVATSKDLEYAFSLYAGLSLHFLIDPFTLLHIYANPEDMQIWKDELRMAPVTKREDANLGVIVNTDIVFVANRNIGGFKVVDDKILLRDLARVGEEPLVKEFRHHLSSL